MPKLSEYVFILSPVLNNISNFIFLLSLFSLYTIILSTKEEDSNLKVADNKNQSSIKVKQYDEDGFQNYAELTEEEKRLLEEAEDSYLIDFNDNIEIDFSIVDITDGEYTIDVDNLYLID